MTEQERDRASIMRQIANGLKVKSAASHLGLCCSQVYRLYTAWCLFGDAGLVSKKRGVPSNRARPADQAAFVSWYEGLHEGGRYAPQQAAELFEEETGISICRETASRWLTQSGYREGHQPAAAKPLHLPRARRARTGELIQVDGCEHYWLNGHQFVLLVFIDDATSRILYARFVRSENTFDYLAVLEDYCRLYGIPRVIYADRHSVFYNSADPKRPTAFVRALHQLGGFYIASATAQGRGRVERVHRTLQNRLVPQLANAARLPGEKRVCRDEAIEIANALLPRGLADYNARFPKPPKAPEDAHLPLTFNEEEMQRIFCVRDKRTLSQNGLFSYRGARYTISNNKSIGHWRVGKRPLLDIDLHYSGKMRVFFGDRPVDFHWVGEDEPEALPVGAKELNAAVAERIGRQSNKAHTSPASHPWKAASYQQYLMKKRRKS